MKNQPLMFKVRLLRDVKSLYTKFEKGSQQTAIMLGGRVSINGYQATTLKSEDWELIWDQDGLDEILQGDAHGK